MDALNGPGRGGHRRLEIRCPKQILVEGRDEVLVFEALATHLGLDDIQANDYGGKPNLRSYLSAFVNLADFSSVQSLAIVADADFNGGARDRIRSALESVQLPQPPTAIEEVSNGALKISYLVLPHFREQGMLEDVCLASVKDRPVMQCVQNFIDCIKHQKSDWPAENREAKALAHAYLVSLDRPDLRLGEAAKRGHWSFNDSAFDPLRQLLSKM